MPGSPCGTDWLVASAIATGTGGGFMLAKNAAMPCSRMWLKYQKPPNTRNSSTAITPKRMASLPPVARDLRPTSLVWP